MPKKRIIYALVFSFVIGISIVYSQNLQLHYDFGKNRNFFTTTLEILKEDKIGFTYLFIDFYYNSEDAKGISFAYWEISRYFKIPGLKKLAATIQYNDGTTSRGPLGKVWLIGIYYPINLGFITMGTNILYRYDRNSDSPDFQITLAWFKPLANKKILFKGFLDIWTKDDSPDKSVKSIVILAEPQLWFNLNKWIAIGGEIEITRNLLPGENWGIKPTIAIKWTF
jgi:hypothetical protein